MNDFRCSHVSQPSDVDHCLQNYKRSLKSYSAQNQLATHIVSFLLLQNCAHRARLYILSLQQLLSHLSKLLPSSDTKNNSMMLQITLISLIPSRIRTLQSPCQDMPISWVPACMSALDLFTTCNDVSTTGTLRTLCPYHYH